uniref:ORF2 protein n=1 Tax=Fowl adenovirus A serotype 1 (strain CELO / Phelps) TaxID=10553 RepID=Q64774_ADEG1|nr:ORF2 [Fowl aviadenovirus 1]
MGKPRSPTWVMPWGRGSEYSLATQSGTANAPRTAFSIIMRASLGVLGSRSAPNGNVDNALGTLVVCEDCLSPHGH